MSELTSDILKFFQQQKSLYPDDFYQKPETVEKVEKNNRNITTKTIPEQEIPQQEEIWITSGNKNTKTLFVCTRPLVQDFQTKELISGKAGELFDKILKAIGLTRKDIYIVPLRSINKNNQISNKSGIDFFEKTYKEINPSLIISLGENAGNELLRKQNNLDQVHGQTFAYKNAKLIYTYHPELVRRDESLKRPVWEDFKTIKEIIKN